LVSPPPPLRTFKICNQIKPIDFPPRLNPQKKLFCQCIVIKYANYLHCVCLHMCDVCTCVMFTCAIVIGVFYFSCVQFLDVSYVYKYFLVLCASDVNTPFFFQICANIYALYACKYLMSFCVCAHVHIFKRWHTKDNTYIFIRKTWQIYFTGWHT